MARKVEVNKQGVFQGTMIEEGGNVRILGEDLTIGANLLPNTAGADSGWGVNQKGYTVTKTNLTDSVQFEVSAKTDPKWFLYYHSLPSSVRNGLSVNTKYTYSFEMRSNVNFSFNISLLRGNGLDRMSDSVVIAIIGDGQWHKYSVTLTTIADFSSLTGTDQYFYMSGGAIVPSIVAFREAKFERGNIQTPWVPNSADAAYSKLGFATANSNIHDPIKAEDFYEI